MGSNDVRADDEIAGEQEEEAQTGEAPASGAAGGEPAVKREEPDYQRQLLYLQADFENYRRRVEREKDEIRKRANENLILELLDSYENLERALAIAKKSDDQLYKGLEMVYNQMTAVLSRNGLRPIEAVGKPFDPRVHEAVMQEISDKEEDTVLEEFQRGYTLNSKVIRCAKVKVSKR